MTSLKTPTLEKQILEACRKGRASLIETPAASIDVPVGSAHHVHVTVQLLPTMRWRARYELVATQLGWTIDPFKGENRLPYGGAYNASIFACWAAQYLEERNAETSL